MKFFGSVYFHLYRMVIVKQGNSFVIEMNFFQKFAFSVAISFTVVQGETTKTIDTANRSVSIRVNTNTTGVMTAVSTSYTGFPGSAVNTMSGNDVNSGQEVMIPIYVSFSVLALVTNIIVVVTILLTPSLRHKTTNLFISNQSCIDSMAALFILANENVGTNSGLTVGNARDEIWCRLWYPNCPVWVFYDNSIANLQVILCTYTFTTLILLMSRL